MKWEGFVRLTGSMPVIETEGLLSGDGDAASLQVQVSRWRKAGKVSQLKKGFYILNEPYRKVVINEYFLATFLERPSYISMEKALEFYGLIPEAVRVFTCLTTRRPYELSTDVGRFVYRHIRQSLFWGYRSHAAGDLIYFVASPEKALLDLIYMKRLIISEEYLEELRLQNTEVIDLTRLMEYASRFDRPEIMRAAKLIKGHVVRLRKEETVI